MHKQTEQGLSTTTWILLGGALLLLMVVLPGLTDNGTLQNPMPSPQQGQVAGVSNDVIGDILQNPGQYQNQTVTVTGEVDDMVGNRSFTIDGPTTLGEDLLVVASSQLLAEGLSVQSAFLGVDYTMVQVSGRVRMMNVGELEQELGIDLDDGAFDGYTSKPYILADQITTIQSE